MKKNQIILVVVLALICFSGCEKDDICAETTPTTPRVIIEFYDRDNQDLLKNVSDLKVVGTGMENGIVFNETLLPTDERRYLTSGNTIALPLKITEDITEYELTLYSQNPEINNTDKLIFNYTRKEIYVSRACGYKNTFELSPTSPSQDNGDTNQWIQNIVVDNFNIDTENEVHIKIYF